MRKVRSDKGQTRYFSEEIYDEILERIENGYPLLKICENKDYPSRRMVYKKVTSDPDYAARFKAAEKLREEFILDEILIIADDESKDHNNSAVYRANCRIKTRQWLLSIFNPERFANYSRQDVKHEGAQGMQPVINVTYSGNKPEIAPEAGDSATESGD